MRRGPFTNGEHFPASDAIVSVVGKDNASESNNPYLKIGDLATFGEVL